MKNICIIPARSGSKGLKDKNIKNLCGKPLIAYTIEAALQSNLFDVVMVSTDSKEYADISIKFGAEVPFLRSLENSSDKASSWDVVKEVLLNYQKNNQYFDNVFLLQPTSPLRDAEDIIESYKMFLEKKANYVVGLCEVDHSPLWCNVLPENNSLKGFINKDNFNKPRQALGKYYRINGAIYIIKMDYLFNTPYSDLLDNDAYGFVMSKKKSIDIDDEFDFLISEAIMNSQKV